MKKRTSYIIIGIIIVVGLLADLLSKHFFAKYFESGADNIVVISNFFEFTYLKNTGAAYGMFGDSTLALTFVSIGFIIAFIVYDIFNHSDNVFYTLGLALIISGAIGNLIDRLFLGYVRDFIAIRLFSFVFNLADLFITFGVIFFVIYLIISMVNEYKRKKSNEVDNRRK